MGKPVYHEFTAEKITEFHNCLRALLETYPQYSMKQYRDYVLTGNNEAGFPDEVCKKLVHMKETREVGIAYEMLFDTRLAKELGKCIKDEYKSGKSLDVFFLPSIYEDFNFFTTFMDMSWYDPIEEAQIALTEPPKNPLKE